jgi:hypothetical protein
MTTRRAARSRDVSLTPDQVAYLDGLLEAWNELPDGAWQAACEDSIRRCGEFRGRDPYDVWLAWCLAQPSAA